MEYFNIDKQTNGRYSRFELFCDKGNGYWERTRSLTADEIDNIESRIIEIFQEYGMGFGEDSLDYEFQWHPK